MRNKEAKELLAKYIQRTCSEEEIALLESWYLDYKDEMSADKSQIVEKGWKLFPEC